MHPVETRIGAQKEIKEQLGHSTIDMTLDTYAHLLDQSRDEANEAMAKRVPKMATEWAAGGNCCPVANNRVGADEDPVRGPVVVLTRVLRHPYALRELKLIAFLA